MVSKSVAATSAETGPFTTSQICGIRSRNLAPDLAIREGLVVTPSTRPVEARSRISLKSAVSMKNFMGLVPMASGRFGPMRGTGVGPRGQV